MRSRSPLLARLLVHTLLRGDAREVIAGDLEEGVRARAFPTTAAARRWYWRAAVGSILAHHRPSPDALSTLPAGRPSMRLDATLQDIRFSLRSYRRNAGLTSVIVITLALGIGAAVSMFSIVDAALLAPLPYPEPERLVALYEENEVRGWSRNQASPANFLSWREAARTLASSSAHGWTTGWAFTGDGDPEWVRGVSIYADFFDVFGRPMTLGRAPVEREIWEGERVVVISHGLWTRAFGSDPEIVGKPIVLDDIERRVIGVAPRDFGYPEPGLDIWAPFRWRDEGRTAPWFRRAHYIWAVGRLVPHATVEEAHAELRAIAAALEAEYPSTNSDMQAGAVGLRDWVVGDRSFVLLLLLAAVAAVLLTACANVANLLLTRAVGRQGELAVRAALGASRGRVLRQLFTEHVGLALLGGALGVLLASRATPLLVRLGGDAIPRAAEIGIDGRVLLFALVTTVATGVLFGLAPAIQTPLARLRAVLGDGSRDTGSRANARTRQGLLVLEVAMAVVLVAGAALLLRSLERVRAVDPGFDAGNLTVARINLGSAERYPDSASINDFTERLRAQLQSHPAVRAVAVADTLPLEGTTWTSDFFVEGYEVREELTIVNRRLVDHRYLSTMGVPVLRGRGLTEADGEDGEAVALINATLAARYFGDDDPVGHRVRLGNDADDPWFRIVGVVGSEKIAGLTAEPWPELLLPLAREPNWGMNVLLRTAPGTPSPAAIFRDELARIDARVPIIAVESFDTVIGTTLATERLLAVISSVFAAITLLLAALGIYGLLAQSVIQRQREIGIRMALGAAAARVVRSIVASSLGFVGIGVVVGAGVYALAARWLGALLFELQPGDPTTLALVAGVLVVAATGAAWLPARRAARLDPARTLRSS